MSKADLINWMERNRPDLERAVADCKDDDDRRKLLNEVTGLYVLCSDCIEDGSAKFLDALIRISQQTPPGAVDNRHISLPT